MTDIPGDTSTTATIGVGGNTTSAIDFLGDHDWYKVTLAAGQAITVTVTGAGNLDTYLKLYDPAGTTVLASNDDIVTGTNTNSRLTFTASTAGTYFIDVGAYANQSTGAYDLFVEPSPPPVWNNDQIAYQLTSGYWGSDVHHFNVTQGGTITVNISSLTSAEQYLALAALADWSDIIGVHFQQVSTGGQIVFSDAEDTTANGPVAQTDANWSNGIITSAHVQISKSWVTTYGTGLNSYSFQTYIHEIGHALGLGHGGEYNDTANYPADALFANDCWATTVMSYFDQHQNTYFANQGFTQNDVMTPMGADIVAMQELYGLSTTTRTGDTTYGFNSNAGNPVYDATLYPNAAYTIFDSGGINTLDYSGFAANQLINLNPETFSNIGGSVGNVSIARGTIIQNAIGGSGADKIIGNSVANVLTGGPGADTLTGGGGPDIFRDTLAGHNGDTITDFGGRDRIVFTDANLSNFTFGVSGNTLTYSGGSLTLSSVPSGHLVASAAIGGGVQVALAHAHNDFNGDGHSDVLLLNDNGTVSEWLGTSTGGFSEGPGTTVGSAWQVAATGDFNGDGQNDILWTNSSGTLSEWFGNSHGGWTPNATGIGALPTGWQVAGAADFNGDGRTDLLLYNSSSGTISEWLAGSTGSFASGASASLGAGWHVAGTGDFNGDGYGDVLLRNDNGTISEWLGSASGGFTAGSGAPVSTSWQIVGTGDLNGDGLTDILWRSTDGTVSEWFASSTGGFTAGPGSPVSTDWHVASIGDFNGDGTDDILWLNSTTGAVSEWLGQSHGGWLDNGANVATTLAASWHVQDPFL